MNRIKYTQEEINNMTLEQIDAEIVAMREDLKTFDEELAMCRAELEELEKIKQDFFDSLADNDPLSSSDHDIDTSSYSDDFGSYLDWQHSADELHEDIYGMMAPFPDAFEWLNQEKTNSESDPCPAAIAAFKKQQEEEEATEKWKQRMRASLAKIIELYDD